MCLTGNQRSACPMTVSMWCWAAWTGIQSMRFTWWQKISRASPSLASSPSEQLQSPPPSQVLLSSSHPEHPHTSASVYKGFHRDHKGSINAIRDSYSALFQSWEALGSDMNHLSLSLVWEGSIVSAVLISAFGKKVQIHDALKFKRSLLRPVQWVREDKKQHSLVIIMWNEHKLWNAHDVLQTVLQQHQLDMILQHMRG